jgi:hypothetical protein
MDQGSLYALSAYAKDRYLLLPSMPNTKKAPIRRVTSRRSRVAAQSLPFELLQEMQPPLVLKRGGLDEIRVSRVRYRDLEWTMFQLWELDPGHGWNLRSTVALQANEWAAVMAELAPPDTPKPDSMTPLRPRHV